MLYILRRGAETAPYGASHGLNVTNNFGMLRHGTAYWIVDFGFKFAIENPQ
ncbi:MAG: hypothetical protein AB1546_14740 [bacterium]